MFMLLVAACPASLFAAAPEPQWIWSSENAANPGSNPCWFRRVFDLGDPESGRVEITADNTYRLVVNGRDVSAGNNWEVLEAHDIKTFLIKGKNVIAVQAGNSDGPAGLVVRAMLKAKGSEAVTIVSDKDWKTVLKPIEGWKVADFDDSAWKPAHVFGPLGKTAPWGDRMKLAVGPVALAPFTAVARPAGKFELLDGDRVAFVGDTLIERAQAQDSIETAFTSRFPDRHVIYRNLGWSGDDVTGVARSGFGTAEDGFKQLQQQVHGFRPTVIFVGYGANASYEGPDGLARFKTDLARLLDMLEVTKATIVLLSPIRQEDLGRPLPDPTTANVNRELFSAAIRDAAADRGHKFIDLFHYLGRPTKTDRDVLLTNNGVHLTPYGYWRLAQTLEQELNWPSISPVIDIDASGKISEVVGMKLTDTQSANGKLSFTINAPRLPTALAPQYPDAGVLLLKVHQLPAGSYTLLIDGQPVTTSSAADLDLGVSIKSGPTVDQLEKLRTTIVAKNQLYFYRWRPQNETYLLGFRKHEQGQNAREIPLFDPLVEAKEQEIAKLRVPQTHKFELIKAK